MGCFSFLCKVSGKPIASSSFDGDACRLFLLKDGKVLEEMKGHYDSYGRVFSNKLREDVQHELYDSFKWQMEWGDICELIFNDNDSDGIAAVLECNWNGELPTTISEQDPDQGWGKRNGKRVKIKEPYHKVYKL